MRIEEIKKQVFNGTLKLKKVDYGRNITRRKYIYSKTKGSYVGEYKIFVPEIERVDKITYPLIKYQAMIAENQGYRISKKIYLQLEKELQK